jgi:glycosyltransferase involved in cell wall biosynthesis
MKILFVCNEYPPLPHGGIGTFVKNLAENLVKRGINCYVIGIHESGNKKNEVVNGVDVFIKKSTFSKTYINSSLIRIIIDIYRRFELSQLLKKIEKNIDPDIIESYDWTGPLLFKPKAKLVVRLHGANTVHQHFEGKRKSKILTFFERRNLSFADKIVSVSNHLLKISKETFPNIEFNNKVLPNFYPDHFFFRDEYIKREIKNLLFVGKFHERKGVKELAQILNELFKLDNQYFFRFVGNHKEEDKNKFMSWVDPNFHSHIEFIQPEKQEKLNRLYNQSSLLIMPSRAEAFGLVVIEAMATGCVVAMSDIPVAMEIIDHNINGLLIDVNQPAISSKMIDSLLNDSLKYNQMSKVANLKAASFKDSEVIQRNIDFYYSIL